ncbi:MAG TPA: 30S ribosomal protein S2 [Candidatus Dormibacteraeota bacterium]|nr:30S ribosomal protein S2 [Candidatus Dormibacteraeota bacterium]
MAVDVDIKQLLEAGAHFGHKTERWHPKMAPYIHSKRGGTHIIDLAQTVTCLEEALNFLTKTASEGKQILLVGTKRQAQDIVKQTAIAVNMPYVTERWLGGMITNWNTIGGRVKYLQDLENRMASGELANKYNKLEVQRFQEEIEQMNSLYGGVKEMNSRPGALFIVDIVNDVNAVREARKLGIPIVALVDTNADPSQVDYPIPANDDAIKTIQLIMDYVKSAIETGKASVKKSDKADDKAPEAKPAPAPAAKVEAKAEALKPKAAPEEKADKTETVETETEPAKAKE